MRVLFTVLGAVALSMVILTATGQSSSKAPFGGFVLLVDGQGGFSVMADDAVLQVDDSSAIERTRTVLRSDAGTVIHVAADPAAPRERVTRALQLVREAGGTAVEVAWLTPAE